MQPFAESNDWRTNNDEPEEHLKTDGEWFWSVTRDGKPTIGHGKVNAWKCPYHNSRACFEMIERLSDSHL